MWILPLLFFSTCLVIFHRDHPHLCYYFHHPFLLKVNYTLHCRPLKTQTHRERNAQLPLFFLAALHPSRLVYYKQQRIHPPSLLYGQMTWSLTMSLMSHGLLTSALLAMLFNLILPATCLDKWPLSTPQAMLMEDKTRLGSMPPSCHNRCNACNPCTAVQVPTLPSRAVHPMDEQTAYSKYSNYKPLGWKCLCGNRLFNP